MVFGNRFAWRGMLPSIHPHVGPPPFKLWPLPTAVPPAAALHLHRCNAACCLSHAHSLGCVQFTSGGYDPWRAGTVLQTLSPTVPALTM